MLEIEEIKVPGYERVIRAVNTSAGLTAFIAIHNTTLGPALGGTRIYPYPTEKEALDDCLRLAKAMTYKSAMAEDGLGGGKSVIIADPKRQKTEKLLHAFGEALETLHGKYIAAEDVGTSPTDMSIIHSKTKYVAALPSRKSSGDPSRFTSRGVYLGIKAAAEAKWGSPDLRGKVIAIQGLGNVGAKLARFLFWEGAELVVCDTDAYQTGFISGQYGSRVLNPEGFSRTECDIFAPCAMGGILNDNTIPYLKCEIIAGAANNQLQSPEHGKELLEKGILYAPDFVINAGGIINAALEFEPGGYDPRIARDRVVQIPKNLSHIFTRSRKEKRPTNEIAEEIAKEKLDKKVGIRTSPIQFT